jgi:hypothetical protein
MIKKKESLRNNYWMSLYYESGYYIYRSSRVYLLICAIPNGQNGIGGHTHSDKLSFELTVDGENICFDPGTYVYTASPEQRKLFRSTAVHNVLVINGQEQYRVGHKKGKGLFSVENQVECWLEQDDKYSIVVGVSYGPIINLRCFTINDDSIEIKNYSNYEFTTNVGPPPIYSNGYGKLLRDIKTQADSVRVIINKSN